MWSQTAILGKGFLLLISLWNGFSPACARLREVKLPFWVKVFVRIPHTGIAFISYISRTRDFRFSFENNYSDKIHTGTAAFTVQSDRNGTYLCVPEKKKNVYFLKITMYLNTNETGSF